MGKFLIIDIGAGTMDILYYDAESNLHYKAVVKSPVRQIAEKAANLRGNLLVTGNEMGGGPVSNVLRQRAQEAEVIMTASSAATIHHNLENVRSSGIKIIEDSEVDDFRHEKYTHLHLGDIQIERLKNIVEGLGVPFSFDVIGICAQDHGVPIDGVSHLDYRHNIFKARLDKDPYPHSLLYKSNEVPSTMNRLVSIAETAGMLPAREIYVMDSGIAAILGASMDILTRSKEKVIILDVATSHTLGAALENREIAGFFEYHTKDITLDRLESLLRELADGELEHKNILEQGGHGAYTRKAFGFDNTEIILATGPKRGLVANSKLPIVFGAPLGDNMMTGTVGVLEAIRRRKGLKPIVYLN
ncbi:MAG: DUF1786 domain-containing protein [Desulfobacterales bacterium]|nr:DUF1786 domain-containing protein [Desulfobacterales bacterium]